MRTRLPFLSALALAGLVSVGAPRVAAQAPTDGVFERFDRDGVITRAEYDQVADGGPGAAAARTAAPGTAASQAMQWFTQADRNGDGKLTPEEANSPRFAEFDADGDGFLTRTEWEAVVTRAAQARQGQARDGDAEQATVYRAEDGGPVPLSDSTAFTDLRFTRDWVPGTKDRNGKLMTGTECNYIVAHGGRLYAAVSMWNHDPAAPNPGPGVLVKPAAAAPWQVDVQFPPPSVRVAVLASLTLTTDAKGTALAKPVTLLVAGGSVFESRDEVAVFVRDDAAGKWTRSVIAPRAARDIG